MLIYKDYESIVKQNYRRSYFTNLSLSLLQVPRALDAESGMRLNKGNVCYTITSPPGVHDAYFDQFKKDFTMFLRMRSIEMVPRGHLFLTLQGKIDENDGFDHWVSIGMTLNDMVMEVGLSLLFSLI